MSRSLSLAMGKPHTEAAPSLPIPLLFMGTGVFGAGIGLGFAAQKAALIVGGQLSEPPVLALVHTLTLGFLTTSMMGALYQWVPVIIGIPLPRMRWAYVHFISWMLGLLSFVWGLITMSPVALALGGLLLAISVSLFVGTLGMIIRRGKTQGPPLYFVISALGYLVVTVVFGGLLDTGLWLPWAMQLPTISLLASHIVIAVGGWLGLTLIGVSYRLFPMFCVAKPIPGRALWVLGSAHLAIIISVIGLLGHLPALFPLSMSLGVLGLLLYLADMYHVWTSRRQKTPGPQVWTMVTGFICLAIALVAGMLAMITHNLRWILSEPLLVLGWFLLSILGFGQKIWPFMVWLHESHRREARTVLHVSELWPRSFSRVIVGIAPLAVGLGWAGLWLQRVTIFQMGALLLSAIEMGVGVALLHMLYRARHHHNPSITQAHQHQA